MYKILFKAKILFCLFFLLNCFSNMAFSTQIEIFKDGLTNPTGLAINTVARKLYVNCGVNGNLWAIGINADGSPGNVELITSGFAPKLDLALDANMNIFGVEHGDSYVYRVDSIGQVSSCKIGYDKYGSSIVIEPPGFQSDKMFFTTIGSKNYLHILYLSSYEENKSISYDGYVTTCNDFNFMQWRKGLNEIIATTDTEAITINPANGSCNSIVSGLVSPNGIAQDNAGNIYIADTGVGTITQVSTLGQITTIVTGLDAPIGLAFDDVTNLLFVSESTSGKISSINMNSTDICAQVVTFAKNPVTGEWGAFPTPCDIPLRWQSSVSNPTWYQNSNGTTGTLDSVILNPDLSFQVQDMKYSPLFGSDFNLEANFKFFGDQNGKMLWELDSYTVK